MNPLGQVIKGLKDEISKLEEEIEEWEDKSASYDDYIDAIYKFCLDCPIKDESLKCVSCFLHKWKVREDA